MTTPEIGTDRNANAELHEKNKGGHRWGVILAGGDGKRLLSLTRSISGDERPKQFCAVMNKETLLQQTQRRISRLIAPHQSFIVLTSKHERYYADQMDGMWSSRLVIQPQNRGTAPAILCGLLRVEEKDPEAIVAIFPSDHHYSDGEAFLAYMDLAYDIAASRSSTVILLGIPAETPEADYGWIEPETAETCSVSDTVLPVKRFWEKPDRALASELMKRGCLWNSFVMVGHVSAFMKLIRSTLPDLVASFELTRAASILGNGPSALATVYASIRSSCFSNDVLAMRPRDLGVLPAKGLGWSDLGEPGRVLSVLARKGIQPVASEIPAYGERSRMAAAHLTATG